MSVCYRWQRGAATWLLVWSSSLLIILFAASPAAAVDLILDSGPITAKALDDGQHEAEVQVLNTGSSVINFGASIPTDAGCTVTPSLSTLEPGRRSTTKLTLSRGCEVDKGTDVTLTLAGGTPASISVKIDPPTKQTKPEWEILTQAAVPALLAAIGIPLGMAVGLSRMNSATRLEERKAKRLKEKQFERERQNQARAEKGHTAAGDELLSLSKTGDPDDALYAGRIGWSSELDQLGSTWSFKDSWISNVTLGASALVLLLAASDILEAVLGEKPKGALGIIAVAAGLSAFLVGLGPLLVKAIGRKTSVPTVLGVTAAGAVVAAGSLFQISAITLQGKRLTDHNVVEGLVLIAGLLTTAAVLFYAARSLIELVDTGTATKKASIDPEVQAAWIIARAIRPDLRDMYLSPLDIAEILEDDKELAKQLSPSEWDDYLKQHAVHSKATVRAGTDAGTRSAIL